MSGTQIEPAQHWHAPALVHDAVPRTHALHEDGTHVDPPLDDVDVPLLLPELDEVLPAMHVPALHVPPGVIVQSVHAAPPMPQNVAVSFIWHMPLLSQQPFAQLVLSQVPPPELVDPPPSSPLLLVLLVVDPLLPYPLELPDEEPVEPDEPDEEAEPELPLLLELSVPDELAVVNFPRSPGSGAPAAQATRTTAAPKGTSLATDLGNGSDIRDSVRARTHETTQPGAGAAGL